MIERPGLLEERRARSLSQPLRHIDLGLRLRSWHRIHDRRRSGGIGYAGRRSEDYERT